jgi:hypothetical protein
MGLFVVEPYATPGAKGGRERSGPALPTDVPDCEIELLADSNDREGAIRPPGGKQAEGVVPAKGLHGNAV